MNKALDTRRQTAPTSGVRLSAVTANAGRSPATLLTGTLERVARTTGTELLAFSTPQSDRLGELLHSRGQVCLMRLKTGQLPLGQRLKERHPETAAAVGEALTVAKAEGRPLGDVLIGLGSVDSGKIREALLDQIADGFVELGRAAPSGVRESAASFIGRPLSSVLSGFSPAEIYWRTIPRLLPALDDAAGLAFEQLAGPCRKAVLFSIDGDRLIPTQATGVDLGSLEGVVQIGRRVEQFAHAPALKSAGIEASMTVLRSPRGSVLLVLTPDQIAMFGGLDQNGLGRALGVARNVLSARGA
jgi:hypothetical protein